MPVQPTAQSQPSGVGNDVKDILASAGQITAYMEATSEKNKRDQEAKQAQAYQKKVFEEHQKNLLASLYPNNPPTAPQGTPTSGEPSASFRSASMPVASTPAPTSDPNNPVEWAKNVASNAWREGLQLAAGVGQGTTQFVTAIPAQAGQAVTNTVQRVGQFITGDKSAAVAQAAKSLEGSSSKEGPGGGNVACAWKTAKALRAAGYDIKPGSPEEVNVNAQIAFLKKRGAVQVPQSEARPGDIVYSYDRHIGIVSEGQGSQARVISNSSSKAQFSWKSNLNFDGYYGQGSQIWRLPTTA